MDWTNTTAAQVLNQRGIGLIAQAIYPENIEALVNDIASAGLEFQTALTPTLGLIGDYNDAKAAKEYEETHSPDDFEANAEWLDAVSLKQRKGVEVGRAMVAAAATL